ncbi:hypothetical protein [uncultured Brevibacillus sp.]|uniref:hypothetical protein n=1 Tax=uncultured Brevibacillus sp. TaxID=169970 RepID=UPI0025927DA6|nr:hypothetical protein [uncultured Brevibacillus sp.]
MSTDVGNLKTASSEIKAIGKEISNTTKALAHMEKKLSSMTGEFSSKTERLKRSMKGLRSEINDLNNLSATPRIELIEKGFSKLGALKQQLLSLSTTAAGIAIGSSIGGMIDEAKAAARERGLYAASGKTEKQMQDFDQLTNKIMDINPYLNKPQAMAMISRSEQLNPENADKYAERAAMLSVTTVYSPEEHLRMMASMREGTGIDDATRLANSIQEMSNKVGDMNGKFVSSIVEFSEVNGKLLNTPEKMAAMVSEIKNLGILNDDKAFGALRESVTRLTNQQELTTILKTQFEGQGSRNPEEAQRMAEAEAKRLNTALASGDKDEQRVALGKVMMAIASIEDQGTQQKILYNLGGIPGKDIPEEFAKLLDAAGKIATGEIRPQVGNEAQKAYEVATKENEYFALMKEQVLAKQVALETLSKVTNDLSGVLTGLSRFAASLAGGFNGWPDWGRYALLITIGVMGATSLISSTIFTTRAFVSSLKLIYQAIREIPSSVKTKVSNWRTKGTDVNTGGPTSSGKQQPRNSTDRKPAPIFQNIYKAILELPSKLKTKWTNGGKETPSIDTGGTGSTPQSSSRKGESKSQNKTNKNQKKNSSGRNSNQLGLQGAGSSSPKNGFAHGGGTSSLINGFSHTESGIAGFKGGAKGLLRRVPLLGQALSLVDFAQSDNKLETAAQLGTEALGGWGGAAAGAAAGAAIGSVVPVLGTAIGGVIGGLIGGFGGSMAGSAAFDGIKSLWQDEPPTTVAMPRRPLSKEVRQNLLQSMPAGPPVPDQSPVSGHQVKPQSISLTIPQITIPLHAEGVLQDIPTMLRMLSDPSVGQRIKDIIEKSLLDALETRGGVTV